MALIQEPVDVPRPRKRVTFGLIVLAIFMPWLALYLDGASWQTVGFNFAVWLLLPIPGAVAAIIHAIICLCRSSEHRTYSNPARRRLRYDNKYSADTQLNAEKKLVDFESEAEPAPAHVQRAVTEPAPTPVERAPTSPPAAKPSATSSATSVTEPLPAPIEKAPTEPPAAKSPVTSSSASLSSNAEKEDSPAVDPPPRTATTKKDDPFKDTDA